MPTDEGREGGLDRYCRWLGDVKKEQDLFVFFGQNNVTNLKRREKRAKPAHTHDLHAPN